MPSTLTVIFVSLVALCVVAGAVRLPTLAEQLTFKLRASTNASDFGDLSKKDVAFSQCCAEKGVFAGIDEIDDKTATGQICNYTNALLKPSDDQAKQSLSSKPDNANQRLSDLLKCAVDSQDDTACCQAIGLQDSCATLCDFTPATINIDLFECKAILCVFSLLGAKDEDLDTFGKCIIGNAYTSQ